MITIVSGTNRSDSYTEAVARMTSDLLSTAGEQVQVLSLRELPGGLLETDLYGKRSPELQAIMDKFIVPVNKFVFVVPEYNGSFPGVLKLFIDAVPPRLWKDKKASIIGVSSGRAGNLRGQEHLTGIFHYLKMHVHYNKPKLSGIEGLMDDQRRIIDEPTMKILTEHVEAVRGW
ncbi:MAG: NADPH-dependent FMN reductase [Flavobacteriales bacterium]